MTSLTSPSQAPLALREDGVELLQWFQRNTDVMPSRVMTYVAALLHDNISHPLRLAKILLKKPDILRTSFLDYIHSSILKFV